MAETFRRIVLKPDGLPAEACAELASGLADAVAWQRELADKSPHVLQFVGTLQETDHAFVIEHEPASPILRADTLFDGNLPPLDTQALLRFTAALLDAMRVAHASNRRMKAHGGLCPGVTLVSPDGVEKLTDFGFAPAICAHLGQDAYLNLAVGLREGDPDALAATGFWETLSPDEFDREDRLCAFVDPESYGTATHTAFEPGSDVITAGFILHLMVEHRHPYLSEQDAHRLVEMAEFMAMSRYNGARRKELRESSDPAVLAWCAVVTKMLARLPQNRPTAQELASELGKHVKAVDVGEILRRRLESAGPLVEQKAWDELRALVKGIAGSEDAPQDVVEQADQWLRLANAHLLLERAVGILKGDAWRDAEEPLGKVLSLPALPAEVAERAEKARAVLDHALNIEGELDQVAAELAASAEQDPTTAKRFLDEAAARVERWTRDDTLLPGVNTHAAQVAEEIASRLEGLGAELERIEAQRRADEERLRAEIEKDHGEAEAWIELLETAVAEDQWEPLKETLDDRPKLTHWPDSAKERILQVEQRLADHVAEEQRREAIEADRRTATDWLSSVKEAVSAEQWDRAEQALAAKPKLDNWPEQVEDDAAELTRQIRTELQRQSDFAQARQWCETLGAEVGKEAWSKAADLLNRRPTLSHWPDDVIEDEARFRADVEAQLEAVELQRRQVAAWIQGVEESIAAKQWQDAIHALDAPPIEIEAVPEEIRGRSVALRATCEAGHAAEIERFLAERSRALHDAALSTIHSAAEHELQPFISLKGLDVEVSDTRFDSAEAPSGGTATLTVKVAGAADTPEIPPFEAPFAFEQTANEPLRLKEADDLGQAFASHVTDALLKLQKTRLADLARPWREGPFPKTQIVVKLAGLTEKARASILPLGSKADAKATAELTWDAPGWRWDVVEPQPLVDAFVSVAADAASTTINAWVQKAAEPFEHYRAALSIEVAPSGSAGLESLCQPVPLSAKLMLQLPGAESPKLLHAFSISSPRVGTIAPDPDWSAAASALNQAVAQAQSVAHQKLTEGLEERLGKARAKNKRAHIKLKSVPKRIAEPVEELRFELTRKRMPTVTLAATWDPSRFAFSQAGTWEEAIDPLTEAAAPAAGGFPVKGVAVGTAVLAVAGVGSYLAMNQPSRSAPPPNPNANVNVVETTETSGVDTPTLAGHTNEVDTPPGRDGDPASPDGKEGGPATPDTETPEDVQVVKDTVVDPGADEGGSVDAVLDDVRGILAQGEALEGYLQGLVRDRTGSTEATPTIEVTLPGLADPVRSIELEAGEGGRSWQLPVASRRGLVTDVAHLNSLLAPLRDDTVPDTLTSVVRAVADDERINGFVDPSTLRLSVTGTPNWLRDGNEFTARDVTMVVQHAGDAASGMIELAGFTHGLVLRDSEIRFRGEDADARIAASVAGEIEATLVRSQREYETARQELLASRLPSSARIEPPPESAGGLATTLRWNVFDSDERQRLRPREFRSDWDARTLRFVERPDDARRLGDLVQAHRLLDALDRRPDPANDWLGKVVTGPLWEIQEPNAAGSAAVEPWMLKAAAPWADPESGPDLPVPALLYFPFDLASLTDESDADQGDVAAVFLETAKPAYWPIVEHYQVLATDPYSIAQGDWATPFGEAVTAASSGSAGAGVEDYLATNPRYVLPKLEVTGTPALREVVRADGDGSTTGLPNTLVVELSGTWGLPVEAPGFAGAKTDSINSELEKLTGNEKCKLTLRLDPDAGNQVLPGWSQLGALTDALKQTLPEARELDRLIPGFAARADVEEALNSRLGDPDSVLLSEEEAFGLLQRIWSVKGATAGNLTSLEEVVENARDRRRGVTHPQRKRPLSKLKPTILVEYFCGPSFTYAVCFAAGIDSPAVTEGPFLLRLPGTQRVFAAQPDSAGLKIGQELIGKVFNNLEKAVGAHSTSEYKETIGVLLAPDRPMAHLSLPSLSFAPVTHRLASCETGASPQRVEWNSLGEFESRRDLKALMCQSWLIDALATPRKDWDATPPSAVTLEATRSAWRVLSEALDVAE